MLLVNDLQMSEQKTPDYNIVEAQKRSTPTSVASFPPEILAEIMSKAIRTPDIPNNKQVIDICHVCRYWRAVCLSTPSLWSSIDASHPKLGWEFLKRCKDTPIDLYALRAHRFSPFWPSDLAAKNQLRGVLTTHWPQVRSLYFDASDALLEVLEEATVHMPLLRSIRLYTTTYFHVLRWNPVMSGKFSNVHTLDLDGVYIPLETPWFRDIVYLNVKLPHPVPDAPSMESLLRILESSPGLEVLKLEWAGPVLDEGEDIPDPCDVLSLPNLEELSLTNTPHSIAYLLSNISVSPPTRVRIGCEADNCAECVLELFRAGSALLNFIPQSQGLHVKVQEGLPLISVPVDTLEVSITARHLGDPRGWLACLPQAVHNLCDLYRVGLREVRFMVGDECPSEVREWLDGISRAEVTTVTIGTPKK